MSHPSGDPPQLPDSASFDGFSVVVDAELHGGEQSRVLLARRAGARCVVKLVDVRFGDVDAMAVRSEFVERVARSHREVVAATRIDGALVHPVGDWLMSVFPLIDGRSPDVADCEDSTRMGSELARLHRSLALAGGDGLGPVRAMSTLGIRRAAAWQPLHGDFSRKNLIVDEMGVRILDFDECGIGPVAYDVANSLYVELFDSFLTGERARYAAFREAFLVGYRAGSDRIIGDDEIDRMIDLRVDALDRWVADLDEAPAGIRTASPEWRTTLRHFVRSFRG